MIHAHFKYPSRILGRTTEFHVLLPKPQSPFSDISPKERGSEKVLWFFHGVGDNAETVLLRTDIAAMSDDYGLTVILPSVENSFCLDLSADMRFRTYLTEELIPFVQETLPVPPSRESHLIGGISMGGYGACGLGLSMPEYFAKIFCLSGALDLKAAARFSRACAIPLPSQLSAKSDLSAVPDWDLLELVDKLPADAPTPRIYLSCSELDMVYRSNLAFAQRAANRGISAEVHTAPGLHDWDYWRENLRPAIEWAISAPPFS